MLLEATRWETPRRGRIDFGDRGGRNHRNRSRNEVDMGLIRFRGHPTKGGYDGDHGARQESAAGAAAFHG